jgi:hypothetical protein
VSDEVANHKQRLASLAFGAQSSGKDNCRKLLKGIEYKAL